MDIFNENQIERKFIGCFDSHSKQAVKNGSLAYNGVWYYARGDGNT